MHGLPHGLWLVRLRAPFDARRYRSAASACVAAAGAQRTRCAADAGGRMKRVAALAALPRRV
jgi:hypothetical protein